MFLSHNPGPEMSDHDRASTSSGWVLCQKRRRMLFVVQSSRSLIWGSCGQGLGSTFTAAVSTTAARTVTQLQDASGQSAAPCRACRGRVAQVGQFQMVFFLSQDVILHCIALLIFDSLCR